MIRLHICFKESMNPDREGNRVHCLLLIKSPIYLLQCKSPYFPVTLEFCVAPCIVIMEISGLQFKRGKV